MSVGVARTQRKGPSGTVCFGRTRSCRVALLRCAMSVGTSPLGLARESDAEKSCAEQGSSFLALLSAELRRERLLLQRAAI